MYPSSFVPIVLAGGSGTRVWPHSRRTRANHVLALNGERTMIQQTVERLLPLAPLQDMWIVASDGLAEEIQLQLPELPGAKLLREPVTRNTTPACGLAAFLVRRNYPDAVLGIFPSDHMVRQNAAFEGLLRQGIDLAGHGRNIVVLGVPPTYPETGFGYIELNQACSGSNSSAVCVRSFTEKPDLATAQQMLASERFLWNSGMFLMKVQTLCDALYEHAPHIAVPLDTIADTYGTPHFAQTLAALYPACQNISIDCAILEPRSRKGDQAHMYCLGATFGWNDLCSWSSFHEHRRSCRVGDENSNVVKTPDAATNHSQNEDVYVPGRQVALHSVQNRVADLSDDIVPMTTHHRSREVGSVVQQLA